tara:strand:- start:45 stop:470 length:426 start_codon:yes stop_codon:yes gene_type:complete
MVVKITHVKKSAQYKTGYGKPPQQSQFKQGQSGNPKGRPKGHKNFKTDLLDELSEQISIQENGKPRKITKQRALIKSSVAKGIKGDAKAANSVFGMILKVIANVIEDNTAETLSETDQMILEQFKHAVLTDAAKTNGDKND